MFIVNFTLCFPYCPAGSAESGQFAHKNVSRSKSLYYIARDKIKHVTPYKLDLRARMVAEKLR